MKNLTTYALGTLDTAFSALEALSEIDYVALGESVIRFAATAAAVVVGVCSYVWVALLLLWDEHGETVAVGLTRLAFATVDLAGEVLVLGRDTRSAVNRLVASLSDRAFYALAGF